MSHLPLGEQGLALLFRLVDRRRQHDDRLLCGPGLGLAIGETVILLQPLLPLLGVSIGKERERQQNDCLANG